MLNDERRDEGVDGPGWFKPRNEGPLIKGVSGAGLALREEGSDARSPATDEYNGSECRAWVWRKTGASRTAVGSRWEAACAGTGGAAAAAGAGVRAAPQVPQKRLASGFTLPQLRQRTNPP